MDIHWRPIEMRFDFDSDLDWLKISQKLQGPKWSHAEYDETIGSGYAASKDYSLSFAGDHMYATVVSGKRAWSTLRTTVGKVIEKAYQVTECKSASISVTLAAMAKMSGDWTGVVKDTATYIAQQRWWNDELEIEFSGVKYYLRDKETTAVMIFEVTPGFVKQNHVLLKVNIFHGDIDYQHIAMYMSLIEKVNKLHMPEMLGYGGGKQL